jgi:hypothetical protein
LYIRPWHGNKNGRESVWRGKEWRMKKSLVLMRHGETVFNKRKRIQGWVDLSLTALGKEPAK